jgi:hypothetical protein
MKKFILLRKQAGEGCDYMIACGKDWTIVEAETREEAWSKALAEVYMDEAFNDPENFDTYHFEDRFELETCTLVEVASMDETTFFDRVRTWEDAKRRADEEVKHEAKVEQFERLKAELGR